MLQVRVMKHTQPGRRQDLAAFGVQTNREVHFLHSVSDRQRHIPSGFYESLPFINTRGTGEIGGPLSTPAIKTDRFTEVT